MSCSLCKSQKPAFIQEDDLAFCCPGCRAVYHILSAQNALSNYDSQPIYQQALKYGIISNADSISEYSCEESEKLHLEILEMWCPSCAELITLILRKTKGVIRCVVDYATDLASIEYQPKSVSKKELLDTISSLGYQPALLEDASQKKVSFSLYLRLAVAFFCVLNLMMFSYPLYATYFDYDPQGYGPLLAWTSFGLSLPVLIYSAWPIYFRFWHALLAGFLGMEALVVIGVSASFLLSTWELWQGGTKVYFDSMCVIVLFVLTGKLIENKAKLNTKACLMQLNLSLPRRGRTVDQKFVLLKDIQIGDRLIALMGEKIVLDGIVVEGEGICNEAIMTGESRPVHKKAGDKVLSGTHLMQGKLEYRVTAAEDKSALKKIIEMIELEIGKKMSYSRLIDQMIPWFVPIVLCMAVMTYLLGPADTAFLNAIAVLLISCPCAIGIAAPAAEAYLIHALAKMGILVRNRGALQTLGKEDVFIFDKTGTITEGTFKLLRGFENIPQDLQPILKGMVKRSIHPIAKAIDEALQIQAADIEVKEFPGLGLKRENYFLGSLEWMHMNQISAAPLDEMNHTVVYFNGYPLILGDHLKNDIFQVLQELKPARTILLSGDHENTVQYYAQQCGFEECKGHYTPLQKQHFIDELKKQRKVVAMIGDGINDAPALTSAHVGIYFISAADISIQVSDLLLTTPQLSVIPKMRRLATKGQRILKQNLFWAFFYNVIGIGLAAAGMLSPLYAAFAMTISSLIVMLNCQRIRGK